MQSRAKKGQASLCCNLELKVVAYLCICTYILSLDMQILPELTVGVPGVQSGALHSKNTLGSQITQHCIYNTADFPCCIHAKECMHELHTIPGCEQSY